MIHVGIHKDVDDSNVVGTSFAECQVKKKKTASGKVKWSMRVRQGKEDKSSVWYTSEVTLFGDVKTLRALGTLFLALQREED
jgi:hypothetical protein